MNNKALVVAVLAALAAAPAKAAYIGSVGFPMKNGGNSLELSYDTGSREVEFDGGANDDLKANRLTIQYDRGLGNGMEVFGRFSPSGSAEFDDNPGLDFDITTFGAGLRWSPKQRGAFKFGGQLSLDVTQGDDQNVDIDWKEITLAGGGSYRINKNVDAYGGLSLLKLDGTVDGGTSVDFNNNNSFGLFGGLDLKPSQNFTVGVELRLVNETSFAFTGRFKF